MVVLLEFPIFFAVLFSIGIFFFFPLSLYFGCFGDLDGYSVDLDITEAFVLLPLLLVLVGGISSSLYWLLQLYTFCD